MAECSVNDENDYCTEKNEDKFNSREVLEELELKQNEKITELVSLREECVKYIKTDDNTYEDDYDYNKANLEAILVVSSGSGNCKIR